MAERAQELMISRVLDKRGLSLFHTHLLTYRFRRELRLESLLLRTTPF